jgi:hypothetical protein
MNFYQYCPSATSSSSSSSNAVELKQGILLSIYRNRIAQYLIQQSHWSESVIWLCNQIVQSSTESNNVAFELLEQTALAERIIHDNKRVPSGTSPPLLYVQTLTTPLINVIEPWVWSLENGNKDEDTNVQFSERVSKFLLLIRTMMVMATGSTGRHKSTLTLYKNFPLLMKLFQRTVSRSLSHTSTQKNGMNLLPLILPGWNASTPMLMGKIIDGNSSCTMKFDTFTHSKIGFPQEHIDSLKSVDVFVKVNHYSPKSLKSILTLLSTTGCLDIIPQLETYIASTLVETTSEEEENHVNFIKNDSTVKSSIQQCYLLVVQKLSKAPTHCYHIMRRLLSLCVPFSTSSTTTTPSSQLINLHHRMLITKYLLLPYVRSMNNELFLEVMMSIYQDVDNNRTLFQICRDSVEVPGNTSTRLLPTEDPSCIYFSFSLIELSYQKLNKNCMSTHMLSKTKNWIDPKTSESTSPDIVLQKVFTKYLATHCRRYVQGEWEEKRNKNIYYKTYYSLFLRQVAYNCLCIVVINTQTKSKLFSTLLLSPKYFDNIGVVNTAVRTMEEEDELSVGTNFDTAIWDTAEPGRIVDEKNMNGGNADVSSINSQWVQSNGDGSNGSGVNSSLRYLSDQYLAGSSLRSDELFSSTIVEEETSNDNDGDEEKVDERREKQKEDHMEVDNDDLNDDDKADTGNDDDDHELKNHNTTTIRGYERVELDKLNRNVTMEYFVHVIDVLNYKNVNHIFPMDEIWSEENNDHLDNQFRIKYDRPIFRIAKNKT